MEEGRSGKWKQNEPITGGTSLRRGRRCLASGQVAGATANRTDITKQSRHHTRAGCPCDGGALAEGAQGGQPQKKRLSNFDEQSHYVVENKGSGNAIMHLANPMVTNLTISRGRIMTRGNPSCPIKAKGGFTRRLPILNSAENISQNAGSTPRKAGWPQ